MFTLDQLRDAYKYNVHQIDLADVDTMISQQRSWGQFSCASWLFYHRLDVVRIVNEIARRNS